MLVPLGMHCKAWRLRMKVTGEKESCLDFLRELVVCIFTRHGTGPAHIEAIPFTGNLEKEVRFDGSNHWIISTELDDQGKAVRKNCKQCYLFGKRNMKGWHCMLSASRIFSKIVVILFLFIFLIFINTLDWTLPYQYKEGTRGKVNKIFRIGGAG